MTAYADMSTAREAIRLGARDFLMKPFSMKRLSEAIQRLAERQVEQPPSRRIWSSDADCAFPEIVGSSPATRELVRRLQRVTDSDVTVLIPGESGPGKELVARSLHNHGRRRTAPFLAINCAALPPD